MLAHKVEGSGHPIIVLHGSRLDHRHMMESVEPVFQSEVGWKRIYLDLPGHGQSPAQDKICSQNDLLSAVMEFVDDIVPDGPFAIIGESRGSYLATGFAHLRSQRISGMALIVPGGSPSADPERLPPHVVLEPAPELRDGLSESELARFDNFMVVQNKDIIEKTRRSKLPAFPLWNSEQEERVARSFDFDFHKRGEVTDFSGPSLIVAGRQDRMSGYLDAMDLHVQFPRSTLAVLDSAGHGLAWERPDLFNALMRDWLNRLRRAIA